MIKKMILLNSANFKIAEFDLSKETFFVGSNIGGKTTSTRALHFLYNAEPLKLGIPTDKDNFKKHYFPYDDSYIIYVFENFFIFTLKRSDQIIRYFSKQVFDKNRIIGANGKLREYKEILRYIKKPSYYCPKTIEEYTDVLYGQNHKYKDFSIASIKKYRTFIEILNLVFNVDSAIVDVVSIKKAIQKALNREDEVLTLDFEKYLRDLKEFERDWHFFRTFDRQRGNIDKATNHKNVLVGLEEKIGIILCKIKYRKTVESEYVSINKNNVDSLVKDIAFLKRKEDGRNKIKNIRLPKIQKEIVELNINIGRLEELKEKYSQENFEEQSTIANKTDGVSIELKSKNFLLSSMEKEYMGIMEVYENKIKDIQHRIKITIPHEAEKEIMSLSHSQKRMLDEDVVSIKEEHNIAIEPLKLELKKLLDLRKEEKPKIVTTEKIFRENKRKLDLKHSETIENLEQIKKGNLKSKKVSLEEIEDIEDENKKLEIRKLDVLDKYKKYRTSLGEKLLKKKKEISINVDEIRRSITPKPNSFGEFLSQEVVNWEKELYPIIDKSLLSIDRSILKPKLKSGEELFGVDIELDSLKTIPTLDEAKVMIQKMKNEKYQFLRVAIEKTKELEAQRDKDINELNSNIEENVSRIQVATDSIKKIEKKIIENEKFKEKEISDYEDSLLTLQKNEENAILKIEEAIKNFDAEMEDIKKQINEEDDKEVISIHKAQETYEYNLRVIKKTEESKKEIKINDLLNEIKEIESKKKNKGKEDTMEDLRKEIKSLEEKYKECIIAQDFLTSFQKHQGEISLLPNKIGLKNKLENYIERLSNAIIQSILNIERNRKDLKVQKQNLLDDIIKYTAGSKKLLELDIELPEKELKNNQFLCELVDELKNKKAEYKNKKADLKDLISKFQELEKYPMVEINLALNKYAEINSILELENIVDSLDELQDFKINKYQSQKKRSHANFNAFLTNTIKQKIINFDNLENDFLKEIEKINRNLKKADFEVIKDISLNVKQNTTQKDSMSSLFSKLSEKIRDSVSLYTENSGLFYQDIPKSVSNIESIVEVLGEIKKKGTEGAINLFDTIDLSISYLENGKKVENKTHIKNDSSSGGNILLKAPIAISILNSFYKGERDLTPFYLIIDEVSRLQHKNQGLLKSYMNNNGFKTLFITPDAQYPNPKKAIYYIFKSNTKNGNSLEVSQMNIV